MDSLQIRSKAGGWFIFKIGPLGRLSPSSAPERFGNQHERLTELADHSEGYHWNFSCASEKSHSLNDRCLQTASRFKKDSLNIMETGLRPYLGFVWYSALAIFNCSPNSVASARRPPPPTCHQQSQISGCRLGGASGRPRATA